MFALRQALASQGRRVVARNARSAKRFGSDMPVPQSQNAPLWHGHDVNVVSEGWETSTYFYLTAALVLQVCVIAFAPETSIESWARPEAAARLKLAEKGFTDFEFGKHYKDLTDAEATEIWQKFADRATTPGEDDDDDDDEDDEDEDEDDEDEEEEEEDDDDDDE
eukprot:CAMPEP_0119554050 /NCGR_PEP_ID=MMETSP1352-20130426/6640_1 /TAXON_ID=265584 /ORGANISM="Stauroneis constricta, Strain CCMP1120" /LENGTH=164 /DNA_ID=CAMNT_0007600569 /DNA_START=120 /DNA_END=614 /DNA_ORIENTATION=+